AAIKAVLDLRGEEAALAVLIECLKNPDPWVRGSVVQGFDATGPKAVPGLIAALQADTDWTRASAALALIYLGPDARDAVPALTASLADCDPEVRGNSAQALGRVGRA